MLGVGRAPGRAHLLVGAGPRLAVHPGAIGESQAQLLGEVRQDPAEGHPRALQRLQRHGPGLRPGPWAEQGGGQRGGEPTPGSGLGVGRSKTGTGLKAGILEPELRAGGTSKHQLAGRTGKRPTPAPPLARTRATGAQGKAPARVWGRKGLRRPLVVGGAHCRLNLTAGGGGCWLMALLFCSRLKPRFNK